MVATAKITLVLLPLLIWTKNFNSEVAIKKVLNKEKPMDGGPKGFYTISCLSLVPTGDNYMLLSFPFALSSWLNGYWVMFRHLWFPAMWPTLLNFVNLFSKALYHFASHTHPKGSYHQEMRPSLCKLNVLQTFLTNLSVNVLLSE